VAETGSNVVRTLKKARVTHVNMKPLMRINLLKFNEFSTGEHSGDA